MVPSLTTRDIYILGSVACHDTFVNLFVLVATISVVIIDMVQASHSVNQMNSMTHLSHAQVCTYHMHIHCSDF